MLERGHIATMYHAGSDSYAQCVVLKPMSKAAVAAETEAAAGNTELARQILKDEKKAKKKAKKEAKQLANAMAESPQIRAVLMAPEPAFAAPKVAKPAKAGETDGEIFRRILKNVVGKLPHTIYSGLDVTKTRRRIKAYNMAISEINLAQLKADFMEAYGDRFIECGRTQVNVGNWLSSRGGDMFVRVKVAK